ncbi:MAG: hypothetical protein J5I52_06650 [Saprospiraceae bacterium]|nr:hypothetical protein [Saprospiraceae bacterium]
MRKFVLLFLTVFIGCSLNAQIVSGSKLTKNIVTTDINGEKVDFFAVLDSGKSIALDVFATWCGPCWSFHQTHLLQQLHEELGPEGTDQIRVFGLEADGATPLSDLFNASNTSWGNWTEGVTYQVINDHAFTSNPLNIAYFPTLYVIRPDRTVFEVSDLRSYPDIWKKALVPTKENDMYFTSTLTSRSFCTQGVFTQRPTFINLGSTPIESYKAVRSINGVEDEITVDEVVNVFSKGKISFPNATLKEESDISIKITEIEGVALGTNDSPTLTAKYVKPLVETKKVRVDITTDYYPGETSFTIKDGSKTLLSHSFTGSENGGGADANKTHSFTVEVPENTTGCMTVNLKDGYGDGMPYYDPELHPVPGVEIYDENDKLLKEKFDSDYIWEKSNVISFGTQQSTSLKEQAFVESLNIYPNPVVDVININMTIKVD